MLWYKSWLETRWRFVIGVVVLILSCAASVLAYPEVLKLLAAMPQLDPNGMIGRRVAQTAALARDYRGYVWSQWFLQNMPQQWTLFAVLIGSGGLLSQASGGGALFTLSLPATRHRLLGIRAATGLAELLVLALVPALVLPMLSPAVGQSYRIGDALVHGACMFVAGSVFFCLTVLLSTVFADVWRPPLIVVCGAIAVALAEQVLLGDSSRFSLFRTMSAETYFRRDAVPWVALGASAAASAVVLYAAARNIARRDF